jgi:hypothetical protein
MESCSATCSRITRVPCVVTIHGDIFEIPDAETATLRAGARVRRVARELRRLGLRQHSVTIAQSATKRARLSRSLVRIDASQRRPASASTATTPLRAGWRARQQSGKLESSAVIIRHTLLLPSFPHGRGMTEPRSQITPLVCSRILRTSGGPGWPRKERTWRQARPARRRRERTGSNYTRRVGRSDARIVLVPPPCPGCGQHDSNFQCGRSPPGAGDAIFQTRAGAEMFN